MTRLERDGLLHRGEREQLQQVVLDDIACGADAVVVPGPATDADVLGHGDLHVIDEVRVPDGLEEHVREPQREQVLHRLLTEVVIDAEHCVGREDALDDLVELARGLQIRAERLLDHDAAPLARLLLREPGGAQLLGHLRERFRRDREVEGVVAHRAAIAVELIECGPQPPERLGVVERALHEPHTLGQLLPDLLAERGTGVLAHRVVHHGGEVLVRPVAAREADQGEAGRQQSAIRQVVDRGHQLLARQVARHAEDDQARWTGDAVQSPVDGDAQRIGARTDDCGRRHTAIRPAPGSTGSPNGISRLTRRRRGLRSPCP